MTKEHVLMQPKVRVSHDKWGLGQSFRLIPSSQEQVHMPATGLIDTAAGPQLV